MSDDFQAALAVALRRLETSDRYEAEVRKALGRYSSATVEKVLSYLKEKRFLDDARTTETVLQFNEGKRAVGVEKVRQKLESRGAPEGLLHRAVTVTANGDAERAELLLKTRYADAKMEDRAKAGRFLYSRGFREETIESVLEGHFGSLDF